MIKMEFIKSENEKRNGKSVPLHTASYKNVISTP